VAQGKAIGATCTLTLDCDIYALNKI
jgi:hypothetical protein